jgi:aerobic carbon-monoxide dehydrogenase medium subunit
LRAALNIWARQEGIMHRFEYCAPVSLAEAISLLDHHGDSARVIAGGTDLLTALKERWERPAFVIGLGAIPDLAYIAFAEEVGLRIGATTTVRAVETSAAVRSHYPVLVYAASTLASIQIRNLATVAGNICRASPSADMPPALLVLDAAVVLTGPASERVVPLAEFFTGPGRTLRQPNELLTEIRIPPPQPHSGAAYIKHSPRRAMDLAVVGVAAAVRLQDGLCRNVRIALGAVAATPRRAREAEAVLEGLAPSAARLAEAAQVAATECSPISDVRGSADYRREMVRVHTGRALQQALESAA